LTAVGQRIALFGILMAWCAVMLALRIARSGTLSFRFLVWNLFLAAIPAVAAFMFAQAAKRDSSIVIQGGWFVLWLAFLPNAPYILTDFVHLAPRPPVPLWYDIALLISYGGTGLLLGYVSVADVQGAITRKHGPAAGWSVALVALLSGFGIYVGRFLRWNSWDVFSKPGMIVGEIASRAGDPLAHPRTIGVTAVYGFGLAVGYVVLRMVGPMLGGDRNTRHE
jgi:uncharacterized membrane protein